MLPIVGRAEASFLHHRNADTRGQLFHRARKIEMLVIHDEAKNAPALAAPVQARETIHKGDVVAVPIEGEIAAPTFVFLRRALKEAETNEASAFVLEMNTYGGALDAAEEITHALNQAKIPTYTFINT